MTHWPGLEPHELNVEDDGSFVLSPGDLPAGGATTVEDADQVADIGPALEKADALRSFVEDAVASGDRERIAEAQRRLDAEPLATARESWDGSVWSIFGEDARPAPKNPPAEDAQNLDPLIPDDLAGIATLEDLTEEDALLAGQIVEDALATGARGMLATRDTLLEAVTDDALREEFLAVPEAERDAWLAAQLEALSKTEGR